MSAHQTYVIACNGDGCRQRFSLVDTAEVPRRATDVRTIAATIGWLHRPLPDKVRDFCPACAILSNPVVS